MNELLRDSHSALNKWLYQFAECIVEGKPVSRKVLELILGLSGFERGAISLRETEQDFSLKLRHGRFKDIRSVRFLCRRVQDIRPNEIKIVTDLRKCGWVRSCRELKGSEILSYVYIPFLEENTLKGFLYLDSTVKADPSIDSEGNQLRRFSKILLQALALDGILSHVPVEIREFLLNHSLKEIQRVRLNAILDRNQRNRHLTARKMGIPLRTFFYQLSRFGVQRKNKRPNEVQARFFSKTAS